MPEGLIATHPARCRDASHLLILSKDSGERNHCFFRDLPRSLRPKSLVVVNDTRVIAARLHAEKPTGGRVEVFLVEPLTGSPAQADDTALPETWTEDWRVLVRGLGRWPVGTRLRVCETLCAEVLRREERGNAVLRFWGRSHPNLLAAAESVGAIPLPPYVEAARRKAPRTETPEALEPIDDRIRYQTVYAQAPGAVAAPTAGLHFTSELLAEIQAAGHELASITLHVGPGTFRPVISGNPAEHRLDGERFVVGDVAAASIRRAQAQGRPIVAVGTTVVRTLETLVRSGTVEATSGTTDLMILPGDEFRVVTDLVTNFHLPRSSLLMLVAAFAGRERVLAAYRDAIACGYHFYSYGDAMFIRGGA